MTGLRRLLLAGTMLLPAGCAIHTDNRAQPVAVAEGYRYAQPSATARVAADPWWQRFGDPQLTALVSRVLTVDNDLASAAIAVRRAQLQAGLADEALWPDLAAGGNWSWTRSEIATTRNYGASTSIAYEADLWGRLGSQRDAAEWQALASAEDLESTALSLVGTTVQLYWQIAYLHRRLASEEQSLTYARQTVALVQSQYSSGAVSLLELREAEQNVLSQEAALSTDRQQLAETRNALGVLLDGQLLPEAQEPQRLPDGTLPALPPGLPVELLGRRPDLRAAELRLRALLRDIDAAAASFYPTLSLTAQGSSNSNISLGEVFTNPVATVSAAIALPFLNWRQLALNRRIAEADFDAAAADFRQVLRQALADVETALSARIQLAVQLDKQRALVDTARETERLYEVRYRAGSVAIRDWLDAQERRRSAELNLLAIIQSRLDNEVTLYLALGGDATLAPPPVPLEVPQR